jgi:hypothetical protein
MQSEIAGGVREGTGFIPKVPGSIEIGPLPMILGEYFVGDLASVLSRKAWKELAVLLRAKGNQFGTEGYFTLSNGRVLVIFVLPNGDGIYPDHFGRNYHVDSGTIGLTLTLGLKEEYDNIDTKKDWDNMLNMSGNIINYEKDFSCMATTATHSEVGPFSLIMFGESVIINSVDELSGIGALLYQGRVVAAKTSHSLG